MVDYDMGDNIPADWACNDCGEWSGVANTGFTTNHGTILKEERFCHRCHNHTIHSFIRKVDYDMGDNIPADWACNDCGEWSGVANTGFTTNHGTILKEERFCHRCHNHTIHSFIRKE